MDMLLYIIKEKCRHIKLSGIKDMEGSLILYHKPPAVIKSSRKQGQAQEKPREHVPGTQYTGPH